MRLSCNGCRVLRKGCSENCSIRPCLEWIKNPESQANATVFLAKFYGRAGLVNLVNAGPDNLRPAIFRSLLYEACGRMVNPIYGSAGLLRSGNWKLCQNTVEAVLAGAPVTPKASEAAATHDGPPLKAYDIRHVNKNLPCKITGELHRVKTRKRFKRSGAKYKGNRVRVGSCIEETNGSRSHGSSLSHQSEAGESRDIDQGLERELEAEPERRELGQAVDGEIELELSLGLAPFTRAQKKPKGLKRSEAFELGVQWYKHM